jgi:cysteine desulfurase
VLPVYLDANATTGQLASVMHAVGEVVAMGPLNASSAHSAGDVARRILVDARETTAGAISADDPDNIVFTSSGTEANNLVINGFAELPGALLIYSAVEHLSVTAPCEAHGGTVLRVDADGLIDLAELGHFLSSVGEDIPVLVCVQAANSETGVIQPLSEIRAVCHGRARTWLHVDAAQALGRMPLDTSMADSISASAHKLHGPLGVGMLYIEESLFELLPVTSRGGGQERGFRSGTQNLPGIAGFARALAARFENLNGAVSAMADMRDMFERAVVQGIPGASVVGSRSPRLPNTSNIMFPGQDAMALMARLDEAGVISSNGSACSSMRPVPSRVLREMGLSEKDAYSCLRFSVSIQNTPDEIVRAARIVVDEVMRKAAA